MSRSTRKPFASVGSLISSKRSKTFASRSVRKTHKQQIENAIKEDELDILLLFDKKSCPNNNRWNWPADGKVRYNRKHDPFYIPLINREADRPDSWRYNHYLNAFNCGPNSYWRKIQRK